MLAVCMCSSFYGGVLCFVLFPTAWSRLLANCIGWATTAGDARFSLLLNVVQCCFAVVVVQVHVMISVVFEVSVVIVLQRWS